MNILTFFDFETTGLPDWKNPSEAPHQPHIVQVGALQVDAATRRVIGTLDLIVRPSGWVIPDETIEVHGITNEIALAVGVPESLAMEMLLELTLTGHRVAYNEQFDGRIGRIAIKRYMSEDTAEQWKLAPATCAMRMASPLLGMGKYPKLAEAYQHFMGRPLEGAHTALADARGCMEVFFAVEDKERATAATEFVPA